jgi:hypothetical protein
MANLNLDCKGRAKMKKKVLFLILTFVLFSTITVFGISIQIEDVRIPFTNISGEPFIDSNNRIQVPLRITMETFGATVEWDEYTNNVIVKKAETTVEVPIGEYYILCNGKKIKTDSVALIKDGKTYLPIRAVLEAFSCSVEWDPINNIISITNKESEDKNIYTSEYLDNLVNNAECKESVLDFRNKDNSRRKGLLKIKGKYFDMYYPNDDYGKRVAEFLTPHMDKVYMMLADIYGLQAKVEVHLIHEKDALSLKEGEIRKREKVTFIWLEPNNDDGGNNLAEFVHEINHNFFSETNGGATNTMWLNEAHAKLIASLYTKYNFIGSVDQWSFYEDFVPSLKWYSNEYKSALNLNNVNSILRVEKAWSKSQGEKRAVQIYGLYLWSYIYNNYSLDEFKNIIRDLGTGDVVIKLENLLDMESKDITEMINKELY